jgi:DNA-binding HxlR family transcriptional regulator
MVIRRKVFTQVPPKVEYSLTARGKSLGPVLLAMGAWGTKNAARYGTAGFLKKEEGTAANSGRRAA